mmetsp:Transcript_23112/g.64210  ORF Transcript_23112/g.64210 Transcript_23112/m.64210 type:complete len:224 (-) Transcript_23112:1864-2535(-)
MTWLSSFPVLPELEVTTPQFRSATLLREPSSSALWMKTGAARWCWKRTCLPSLTDISTACESPLVFSQPTSTSTLLILAHACWSMSSASPVSVDPHTMYCEGTSSSLSQSTSLSAPPPVVSPRLLSTLKVWPCSSLMAISNSCVLWTVSSKPSACPSFSTAALLLSPRRHVLDLRLVAASSISTCCSAAASSLLRMLTTPVWGMSWTSVSPTSAGAVPKRWKS